VLVVEEAGCIDPVQHCSGHEGVCVWGGVGSQPQDTAISLARFEPTIPVFELSKTVRVWGTPLTVFSRALVKNVWTYTSTPQYVLLVWCLIKHRYNLICMLHNHNEVTILKS